MGTGKGKRLLERWYNIRVVKFQEILPSWISPHDSRRCNLFFLSFFLGWLTTNLITGLSGWGVAHPASVIWPTKLSQAIACRDWARGIWPTTLSRIWPTTLSRTETSDFRFDVSIRRWWVHTWDLKSEVLENLIWNRTSEMSNFEIFFWKHGWPSPLITIYMFVD